MSRGRGRPARADGPAFDRDAAEKLIRNGELALEKGKSVLRFPGPGELARRFGVSQSTISRFAASLGLPFAKRRHGAKRANAPRGATATETSRKRGPRAKDAPPVPWAEIEKILVEGESARLANGGLIVFYPEGQELAQRFGVHPSTISRFSTKHRCAERRAEHRRKLLEQAPVQLTAQQANDVLEGTGAVTGDPEEDLIIARRIVVRNFRKAAEAGEVRANDPVVVRESDRLGREAHDRKYGGESESDFQRILAAARQRALEGRRRFEALPIEATGKVIDASAVEVEDPRDAPLAMETVVPSE